MITIMTLTSAKGNKARKWFDAHNIEYQNYLVRHQPLTPEVIHKLLLLSPNGFDDLLHRRHSMSEHELLLNMSVKQLTSYVIAHPTLLKYPIIYDEQKLMVGWNADEVGKFIPAETRRQELRMLLGSDYHRVKSQFVPKFSGRHHIYI